MRILLVSGGSGSRGGGEIFLDYLGKGLSDHGHEVIMWIPNHPRMDELAEKSGRYASVIRSKYRNTYDYLGRSLSTCLNWGVSARIAREWKMLQPDVIHINKQNLEDSLDLLRAACRCAVPSVCTIHLTQNAHYLRARAAWLRDRIAHWQLSRFSGIFVAVQEQRCAMLRDFLGFSTRTRTIFNGVPLADITALRRVRETKRSELGLRDSDFLVLGVGRLVEQKRPFLFISIAKELHKQVPNTRFLWIGDGTLAEKWRRAVALANLSDVISCSGWQPDVVPFLAAGDLLLHAAEFEGLPFGVIEAMAADLACAVTRDLGSEIPFFNEENVLFLDDIGALADKLQDPAGLSRVAAAGRRLVEDRLSARNMVESYERLYYDLLTKVSDENCALRSKRK